MTKRKWTWLQRKNMQRMAEALVVSGSAAVQPRTNVVKMIVLSKRRVTSRENDRDSRALSRKNDLRDLALMKKQKDLHVFCLSQFAAAAYLTYEQTFVAHSPRFPLSEPRNFFADLDDFRFDSRFRFYPEEASVLAVCLLFPLRLQLTHAMLRQSVCEKR